MNDENHYQANYKPLKASDIHYNEQTKKYEVIDRVIVTEAGKPHGNLMSSVHSYYPNDRGLYNMNGNVAEMVAEKNIAVGGSWNSTGYDIRNESIVNYTEASPLIGFRPVIYIGKQ